MAKRKSTALVPAPESDYTQLVSGITTLLDQARRTAVRSVNSILTATYWEVGRRIVEFEQGGRAKAEYGEALLKRLGGDLSARHGRGFSWRNLFSMRAFYLGWEILQTPSAKFEARVRLPSEGEGTSASICQTPSGKSRKLLFAAWRALRKVGTLFPLFKALPTGAILSAPSIELLQSKIQTPSGKFRRSRLRNFDSIATPEGIS